MKITKSMLRKLVQEQMKVVEEDISLVRMATGVVTIAPVKEIIHNLIYEGFDVEDIPEFIGEVFKNFINDMCDAGEISKYRKS